MPDSLLLAVQLIVTLTKLARHGRAKGIDYLSPQLLMAVEQMRFATVQARRL